jgi:hypothetical protein
VMLINVKTMQMAMIIYWFGESSTTEFSKSFLI